MKMCNFIVAYCFIRPMNLTFVPKTKQLIHLIKTKKRLIPRQNFDLQMQIILWKKSNISRAMVRLFVCDVSGCGVAGHCFVVSMIATAFPSIKAQAQTNELFYVFVQTTRQVSQDN